MTAYAGGGGCGRAPAASGHHPSCRRPGAVGRARRGQGHHRRPLRRRRSRAKFVDCCRGHDGRVRNRRLYDHLAGSTRRPISTSWPRRCCDWPLIGEPARRRTRRRVRRAQGTCSHRWRTRTARRPGGWRGGTVEADFSGQFPGRIGRRPDQAAAQLLGDQAFRDPGQAAPGQRHGLEPGRHRVLIDCDMGGTGARRTA